MVVEVVDVCAFWKQSKLFPDAVQKLSRCNPEKHIDYRNYFLSHEGLMSSGVAKFALRCE